MKIEQVEVQTFKPIQITLETQEEVTDFRNLVYHGTQYACGRRKFVMRMLRLANQLLDEVTAIPPKV